MNKRGICVFSTILSLILFLCIYGYMCYQFGLSRYPGSDFSGMIFIFAYYTILLLVTMKSIHLTYFSKKYYLFTAIYSLLFSCLMLLLWIVGAFTGFVEDAPIWLMVLMSIFTPAISVGYFYGAFFEKSK